MDEKPLSEETTLETQLTEEIFEEDQFEEKSKNWDLQNQFPEFEGWEEIGFHRPLSNELWEIFFEMINLSWIILAFVYVVPLIAPFPESSAYRNWAWGIWGTVFMVFDKGTNFHLSRFIAEYRTKDPRKMMEYVSFFIKYQMWTGIIQVTLIAWFALEFITSGAYVYLLWLILFQTQKQYPGMLGIFEQVLSGIQHYQYVQVSNWVQNKGLDQILNIGILIYARHYGETHPEIGILMAIAIFGTFSNYIDDVIFTLIDIWYLNKVFKKYMGFSLKDAMNFQIGKDVYRSVLIFGVPGSIMPAINGFIGTYMFFLQTRQIPGSPLTGLLHGVARQLSGLSPIGDFKPSTSIAEAYMAGKETLAKFYISFSMKWHYNIKILFVTASFGLIPFFVEFWDKIEGLQYYALAIVFVPFVLIKSLIEPILNLPHTVMISANKLNHIRLFDIIGYILYPIDSYYWIMVYRVQDRWGIYGIVFLLVFGGWIPRIIIDIGKYLYVRRVIMKIKIYWMPTFIIPIISGIPSIPPLLTVYNTIWGPVVDALGFIAAAAICLPIILFMLAFIYFPITYCLGAYDDYQQFIFKKLIELSGPSKWIFNIMYKGLLKLRPIAIRLGTYGRYSIPFEEAHKQIEELMAIKRLEKQKMELEYGNRRN